LAWGLEERHQGWREGEGGGRGEEGENQEGSLLLEGEGKGEA